MLQGEFGKDSYMKKTNTKIHTLCNSIYKVCRIGASTEIERRSVLT